MNRNSFPELIKEEAKESTGFSPINRGMIEDCTKFIFNQQIELTNNKESVHSLPTIYAPIFMYMNSTKVSFPNRDILFSQLLDLFEIIFNQKNLPITLSLSENIEVLKAIPDDDKDESGVVIKKFANANPFLTAIKKLNPQSEFDTYNVIKCVYENKEEIIGITSPFTLVSPVADIINTNFYRKNPNYFHKVRNLKDRNKEFISYAKDIHDQILDSGLADTAGSYLAPFRTYLKGQIELVESELEIRIPSISKSNYEESPFVNLKFVKGKEIKEISIWDLIKNEDVISKYKIKPTKKQKGKIKLPLILKSGLTGTYFDEYKFPGDFKIDGAGTNILPVFNYNYDWLNPLVDFLEPELMILDYEINKEFLRIGKKRDGIKKCFLPIKPKFFDYFEGKDINELFEIEMLSSGKEWKVKLNIPINDNNIKSLQFEKVFTMNDRAITDNIGSVVELRGDDCPYFAFWPALECKKQEDYYIFAYDASEYKLKINCPTAAESNSISIERERSVIVNKFKSKFPEYLTISLAKSNEEHNAVIVPFTNRVIEKYEETKDVYVSIDFGTTNTNVGIHLPRDKEQIWSFDNEALLQQFNADNTIKDELTKVSVEDFHKLMKTYFLPQKIQFEKVDSDSGHMVAQIPFGSLLLELLDNTKIQDKESICNTNIPYFINYGTDKKNQLVYEFKWGQKNDYISKFLEEVLTLIKVYLIENGIDPNNTILLTAYPMVYSSTNAEDINKEWMKIIKKMGYKDHKWSDEGTASKFFYSKQTGKGLGFSEGTSIVLDIGGGTTDFCITCGGKLKATDSLLFGGRDLIGWFDLGSEDPKKPAMNPIVRFLENRIYGENFYSILRNEEYPKTINSQLKFRYVINSPFNTDFNSILFSNSDFAFSKIIVSYFFVSLFYYMGMLFKSKAEFSSVPPSLICMGGNSSKFLDWLVKTDWNTSISKSLVCDLFNNFFLTGLNKKHEKNIFTIYKSDQPKNEVVLGLLLNPPQTKEFKEVYKNRYCIYGDTFSRNNSEPTTFEQEQIRATENKLDGKKSLKLEKNDILEVSLNKPDTSRFYSFNKKFIDSIENLEIFEDIRNSESTIKYWESIKPIILDHSNYTNILREEIGMYIDDASNEISTSLFILMSKGMLHKILKNANGFLS